MSLLAEKPPPLSRQKNQPPRRDRAKRHKRFVFRRTVRQNDLGSVRTAQGSNALEGRRRGATTAEEPINAT